MFLSVFVISYLPGVTYSEIISLTKNEIEYLLLQSSCVIRCSSLNYIA